MSIPPVSAGSWLTRLAAPRNFHQSLQVCFVLFFCFVGVQFSLYVLWAMGLSPWYVSKPAAVGAFLPISGLMNLKRLLLSGVYDSVHPAALTVVLMALLSAVLFRKGFCGYLCPVGWISLRLDRLGKRLGISRKTGPVLSLLLSLPKYALLGFFLMIIVGMSVPEIEAFNRSPYNLVVDSRMWLLFAEPTPTFLVTLGVLVVGSLLISGFWCRGFCPYGALLGLLACLSPCALVREASRCTGCRACSRACPSRIPVHRKQRISGPECTGCSECLAACPERECLSVRLGYGSGARRIPFRSLGLGSAGVVVLLYGWALGSGHWGRELPQAMVRGLHQSLRILTH